MEVRRAVIMTDRKARKLRKRKERFLRATRDIVKVISNIVFAITAIVFMVNVVAYDTTPYYKELAGALILSLFASGIAAGVRQALCGE